MAVIPQPRSGCWDLSSLYGNRALVHGNGEGAVLKSGENTTARYFACPILLAEQMAPIATPAEVSTRTTVIPQRLCRCRDLHYGPLCQAGHKNFAVDPDTSCGMTDV